MTTVEEMTANVKTSMEYLDVILPKGSTVVTIALADGRILYDTMQDQIHPILVTYPQVYDYLDCVNSNPCWGWLNTNETWRDLTTERAQNLSAVYTEVKKANTYENFDMLYFDPNWDAIVSDWTATGQPAADLIEKIDGFHPSQTGQNLLADKIWKWLENNHPEALGDTNPNNDAIKAQFGKQGGF
jgi:acyloxyacyl hydrolase